MCLPCGAARRHRRECANRLAGCRAGRQIAFQPPVATAFAQFLEFFPPGDPRPRFALMRREIHTHANRRRGCRALMIAAMSEPTFLPRVLFCRACDYSDLVLAANAAGWLQKAGMQRSGSRTTPAELAELLPVAAGRIDCPGCGTRGLALRDWLADDAAWTTARRCESCGRSIEPERLEWMPLARQCVACQRATERVGTEVENEFCPRCGSAMTLRTTRAGVTKYALACTNPRCR